MESFCYQCEQTVSGGCVSVGNCGKDPTTSVLQDLVFHATKGVASWAHRAEQLGARDREIGRGVLAGLFATVTNVNFDPDRLTTLLGELGALRTRAYDLYARACAKAGVAAEQLRGPAAFQPAGSTVELLDQAPVASLKTRLVRLGADVMGLQELLTYGLKGTAAYAEHARCLGREDDGVYAFLYEALDLLSDPQGDKADVLLKASLRCGEINLKVMALLDAAHTDSYGHPEPTTVKVSEQAGKCILISGHDLRDLELLLEQTAGTGIRVYTHGEMLPAHGYPKLKAHPHLAGNYGGAWQDQRKEFLAFPGPIVMTTNCIQKPREEYRQRIFTSGQVAWPEVTHLPEQVGPDGRTFRDFSVVIKAALEAPGFAADAPEQTIMVGFGHHAVLSVAGQVVEAVKSGALRHFFLIGGCDGAQSGRSYYTELAQAVPDDCVILTLACGKYRFNKLDFGAIGGIPRLLDVGQCNDAFSAVKIAQALAEAFGTDVNGLPLSLVVSWYEQKAVAVLLTLLHLGIRKIRLGPSLPAFLTPALLEVLNKTFELQAIGGVEQDLAAMLSRA